MVCTTKCAAKTDRVHGGGRIQSETRLRLGLPRAVESAGQERSETRLRLGLRLLLDVSTHPVTLVHRSDPVSFELLHLSIMADLQGSEEDLCVGSV